MFFLKFKAHFLQGILSQVSTKYVESGGRGNELKIASFLVCFFQNVAF